MDKNQINSDVNAQNNSDVISVDILHIVKALWHRAWIIVLSGILAAAIGFSMASFVIAPKYSSSILLYVNTNTLSVGDSFSITPSQLSAAQSLVKTYIVMLQNRTTLEKVIDRAEVSYTYEELSKMITANSVNDTEVMQVTVTSNNPYEAAKIVNAIAEVLPERIDEIIDGSTMAVVDSGAVNLRRVSPNIVIYTLLGLVLGVLLSASVLAILAMMDDAIRDEEYILKNYNYPILAKIPNLTSTGSKSYGYYYQQNKSTK